MQACNQRQIKWRSLLLKINPFQKPSLLQITNRRLLKWTSQKQTSPTVPFYWCVLVLWSWLAEQKPRKAMHSHKQVQSESWCESEYISSSDVQLSLTGSQPKLLVISISIIGCPSPCWWVVQVYLSVNFQEKNRARVACLFIKKAFCYISF